MALNQPLPDETSHCCGTMLRLTEVGVESRGRTSSKMFSMHYLRRNSRGYARNNNMSSGDYMGKGSDLASPKGVAQADRRAHGSFRDISSNCRYTPRSTSWAGCAAESVLLGSYLKAPTIPSLLLSVAQPEVNSPLNLFIQSRSNYLLLYVQRRISVSP